MKYPNAAGGLKMLFLAQILSIAAIAILVLGAIMSAFGGLLLLLMLGSLVAIASGVLEILGLNKAGMDDEGYRGAMLFAVIGLVVSLINSWWLSDVPFVGTLLSLAGDVLVFLVVNAVCQTTGNLLHGVGNEVLSERGAVVAKIYLICTVVNIVCTIVGAIPILGILAGIVNFVSAIVSLVGYVMYLTFLSGSSNAL